MGRGGLLEPGLGCSAARVRHDQVRSVGLGEGVVEGCVGFYRQAEGQGGCPAGEQDDEGDDQRLEPAVSEIGSDGGEDGVHRTASRAGSLAAIAPSTIWTMRWA